MAQFTPEQQARVLDQIYRAISYDDLIKQFIPDDTTTMTAEGSGYMEAERVTPECETQELPVAKVAPDDWLKDGMVNTVERTGEPARAEELCELADLLMPDVKEAIRFYLKDNHPDKPVRLREVHMDLDDILPEIVLDFAVDLSETTRRVFSFRLMLNSEDESRE